MCSMISRREILQPPPHELDGDYNFYSKIKQKRSV